jgi:hypothetical protein
MWDAQQRYLREQEARMLAAHAARRAEAGTQAVPTLEADADRRVKRLRSATPPSLGGGRASAACDRARFAQIEAL